MDSLTITFSRPHHFKLYAWLIMKVERTPFSHVSISWKSEYLQREIVYQASGTMVNFCEGQRFAKDHLIVDQFVIPVNPSLRRKVIQFAMDRAGIPYGFRQVIGIMCLKLFGKNPFQDGEHSYVCCELTADLLKVVMGYEFNQPLDNITPRDLYRQLAQARVSI